MSYLKEIQINKTEKKIYLMDMEYHVFAELPMSTDFYEGTNEAGQPYSNAEDGVYHDCVCDIDWPDEDDLSAAYGYAYLGLDSRGRACHGGGSNLGWDGAMQPFQEELLPTYGCFRMYNADVWWMCQHYRRAKAAGIDVVVHVVS